MFSVKSFTIKKSRPFIKIDMCIPGVDVEFRLTDKFLELHFFSEMFPADFVKTATNWAESIGTSMFTFYPEVSSWYASIEINSPIPWPESRVVDKLHNLGAAYAK